MYYQLPNNHVFIVFNVAKERVDLEKHDTHVIPLFFN